MLQIWHYLLQSSPGGSRGLVYASLFTVCYSIDLLPCLILREDRGQGIPGHSFICDGKKEVVCVAFHSLDPGTFDTNRLSGKATSRLYLPHRAGKRRYARRVGRYR